MNILGIDFEDWFHPELIQKHLKEKGRPKVVNGIDRILDWLQKNETFATFFVVGELLEYKPEILDKILSGGHEIAFHTMYHTRIDSLNFKDKFISELQRFGEITNKKSKGFRAPTFSLNYNSSWLIDVLSENNYLYDSSVIPAKTNMYGIPDAQETPYRITSSSLEKNDPAGKIIEFPLSVTRFLGKKIPAAGGFYLRTLPLKIIQNTIERYEKNNAPACFYIHSWELTSDLMPRVNLPMKESFVTYHNLEKAFSRMDKLIQKYRFTSFEKYLSENQLKA